MGGLGVKIQHFPLTLLVVLTTLTLPCEREKFTLADFFFLGGYKSPSLRPCHKINVKMLFCGRLSKLDVQ